MATALVAAIKGFGVREALRMHGYELADPTENQPALTVGQWIRRYINGMTGIEQSSIDNYETYLRQDIEPTLGMIPLAALTEEHIADWVNKMKTAKSAATGRVVKPKTIRNRHGFLSGALNAAVARKLIAANPAAGRRLPRTTSEADTDAEADRRMLTRNEFDRLVNATPEHYRPLVRFLVASGCRWGEATALKPEDIDQETETVKVRRAVKYSSNGYTIGAVKTKRSRRTINIPKDILDALDLSGEWVFRDELGRPVRYHRFKPTIWDRAVSKAELDPAPTPHALRHTCGSWMLGAGVPLVTVSRHLGHESITMTANVYADVDRTSHAAAAEAMAKLLS